MTKIKSKKKDKNVIQKKGTLDQRHTEKIEEFDKQIKSIPQKRLKLERLMSELSILKKTDPNKYDNGDIRRKAYLMDTINKTKTEIVQIENRTESLDYIVNTLPILVDYYDNSDTVEDGIDEEYIDASSVRDGKKNILSYFYREIDKSNINNKQDVSKQQKISTGNKISKAILYDNYLGKIDYKHRKTTTPVDNICKVDNCGGEKILVQNDGYLVCNKCGISDVVFVTTDKPNYKEQTQDTGTYAYKRINHLTEILSQLQAKESTDIPQKVYDSIFKELKKRKINKNELEMFKLRRILKKLELRKYYEHVPHILQIINGREPPNFSRNDEIKIKKMFKDIQKPFAIYCPKDRKNFLNYSYVLHKFCELLGLDEFIGYFPLLKNNSKLRQHDKIWKSICGYMRWKFYKSI